MDSKLLGISKYKLHLDIKKSFDIAKTQSVDEEFVDALWLYLERLERRERALFSTVEKIQKLLKEVSFFQECEKSSEFLLELTLERLKKIVEDLKFV